MIKLANLAPRSLCLVVASLFIASLMVNLARWFAGEQWMAILWLELVAFWRFTQTTNNRD